MQTQLFCSSSLFAFFDAVDVAFFVHFGPTTILSPLTDGLFYSFSPLLAMPLALILHLQNLCHIGDKYSWCLIHALLAFQCKFNHNACQLLFNDGQDFLEKFYLLERTQIDKKSLMRCLFQKLTRQPANKKKLSVCTTAIREIFCSV